MLKVEMLGKIGLCLIARRRLKVEPFPMTAKKVVS
jgi:hypothetical protein